MSDDLQAAVAAGVLGSEDGYRSLLQSIVEVARAIFSAQASSVLLFDEEADEAFVFRGGGRRGLGRGLARDAAAVVDRHRRLGHS